MVIWYHGRCVRFFCVFFRFVRFVCAAGAAGVAGVFSFSSFLHTTSTYVLCDNLRLLLLLPSHILLLLGRLLVACLNAIFTWAHVVLFRFLSLFLLFFLLLSILPLFRFRLSASFCCSFQSYNFKTDSSHFPSSNFVFIFYFFFCRCSMLDSLCLVLCVRTSSLLSSDIPFDSTSRSPFMCFVQKKNFFFWKKEKKLSLHLPKLLWWIINRV